jgi:DMSO/TMAO reductase YedYZ molybdopterin-dependent catalytic subunit
LEEQSLNKQLKITLSVAVIAIIVVGVATSYLLMGSNNSSSLLPSGAPPQAQISLIGDLAAPKTFTVAEVSQMPLANVTTTIKDETATYVGVTLTELLSQAGANWDAGFITVSASDGYSKTIDTYQVFNSSQYPDGEILLAIAKDGKWITDTSEGPFKLITPCLESGYNVKSVAEINLQPWTIAVTGTTQPLNITGADIANYEVKTVNAAFAPGGEPQRTSDWTGISLWSVLQAAGMPQGASKVTVTAIDGYSRDYTVTEVQNTGMLIGYQENGQYLKPNDGQPFRLFVPTEDLKWGQNWVRWVSQVTVS